jgi:hypothetical protein
MTARIASAFFTWLSLASPFGLAQQPHRTVQVVIIGVTKFDIPSYNNSVLTDAISSRCAELETYFKTHLGAGNVTIHSYCTPELTSREHLRHLFAVDIPSFSANTLTMIFLMSHGEAVSFNNDFLKSDVEIIASDTKTSDEQNDSKSERLFSSVLLGSEALTWLQRAPAGSTILMFVDTCHSGSASSLSTNMLTFLQQQFGLGSLVLASALPSDNTYQAAFTEALMNLWDAGTNCLNEDTLPNDVFQQMSTQVPLTGSEGLPTFIVKYNGPLCLGNFGKDRKLLFIYAGHDAQQRPYNYQIAEDLSTGSHPILKNLLNYTYLPIPLDAKKYTVNIKRDPDVNSTWNVDFESSGPQVIWLDSTAPPADVGRFAETMVTTAERNGSSDEEITTLRRQAVAVYRAIGLDDDASRIEATLRQNGSALAVSPVVKDLAFRPLTEFSAALKDIQSWSLEPAGLTGMQPHAQIPSTSEIGHQLELMGDFRNAAVLYKSAANAEKDSATRSKLADNAYFALGASGDAKSAKDIRQKFSIPVGGYAALESQALKDKSGQTQLTYRALSIIHALSRIEVTVAVRPSPK